MKILTITDLFPTPNTPTHGIFIFQWAYHLAQNVDVTVYQAVWEDKSNPLTEKTLEGFRSAFSEYPLPFRWIQCSIKFFLIDRIWIRNIQFLRKIKKERNIKIADYDVIIGQMGCPGGYVATKLAKKYNKPSIVGLRGSDVTGYLRRPILKQMALWTYKNCSKIVTVSEDLKKQIIRQGIDENKIYVIKNGINPVFRILDKETSRKTLQLPNTKIILFIGHLIKIKGIDYLIEALANFGKNINFKLYLIGSGEEKENFINIVKEKNLSGVVDFVGSVNHSELVDWYNAADVFCLPSLREGIPNVILESLACGTPVVATNIGNNSEIIGKSTGILVEPQNSQQLRDALQKSLIVKWNRNKISNSVKVFSWKNNIYKYLKIINSLAKIT
jgi:glycosyltransferase involved in cell wall biosynthesis